MSHSEFMQLIYGLVDPLVGGAVVLFIAKWVTDRDTSYGNLDRLYADILGLYFEHPRLAQLDLTAAYAESFTGEERAKYELLAYRVFTFLETAYDTRKTVISKALDREWQNIFRLEMSRHAAWYRNNRALVSSYFGNFVDAELVRAPQAHV